MTRSLFDCFTFFNELDILELRLQELSPLVDKFVLVEGTRTFTGLEKPLHFQENKHRFARYLDKIIHIVLEDDDYPHNPKSAWDREHFSRRAIARGLHGAGPDDFVLVSDVDEIPHPDALAAALRSPLSPFALTVFESELRAMYLDARPTVACIVQSPRLVTRRYMQDAQALRSFKPQITKMRVVGTALKVVAPAIVYPFRTWAQLGHPLILRIKRRSAWHFTSIGDADHIKRKMLAFSHVEVATPEHLDPLAIERLLTVARSDVTTDGLPKTLTGDLSRWKHCLATMPPEICERPPISSLPEIGHFRSRVA